MRFEGLRIGLVGPLPPLGGGMANQTRQLSELLSGERATVVVVRTNSPLRPAGVARVPIARSACRLAAYLPALWKASGRCDLFHVMANSGWSWHLVAAPAIWVGLARKVPVVVNFHGGEAGDFLTRWAALVRFSMRRAAALLVPSRFLQEMFSRHGMQSQVVPNLVDLTRFRPGAMHSSLAPHLVVARNLEPIYDNETALRAFAIVRQRLAGATLTIAGTGPEEERLRALSAALGLGAAVRFAGWLDRDGMAALYRSADISLNPSRADNMPISVLEALASGVPVVSTNVGGIPFMVEDGRTALLVPMGEPDAMAAASLRLLEDRALWHRLSRAGLTEVQRYTWSRIAPELASVYRMAIEVGR
jgi:glycosyltransferase involved in cell wall biosynthesis